MVFSEYMPRELNSVTTLGGGGRWEMGGYLQREGTYVYMWLIHADVKQKPTQYSKAIILQLKKKIMGFAEFKAQFELHSFRYFMEQNQLLREAN